MANIHLSITHMYYTWQKLMYQSIFTTSKLEADISQHSKNDNFTLIICHVCPIQWFDSFGCTQSLWNWIYPNNSEVCLYILSYVSGKIRNFMVMSARFSKCVPKIKKVSDKGDWPKMIRITSHTTRNDVMFWLKRRYVKSHIPLDLATWNPNGFVLKCLQYKSLKPSLQLNSFYSKYGIFF